MKIGELAKQAGCLVETVRYYEHEGLLSPPHRDAVNNYRRYDASHLERLIFIRRCRALDMNHEEIRQLLKAKDAPNQSCQSINQLIADHLIHVQTRLTELTALEKQLSELQNLCLGVNTVEQCGILEKLGHAGDLKVLTSVKTSHRLSSGDTHKKDQQRRALK